MCNPVDPKSNSVQSPNSARKKRTKTRKPKFLSLNLKLSPENSKSSGDDTQNHCRHQLNLFPLNPEIIIEEKDTHDENVAYLLNTDGGDTLTGVLAGVSSEQDSLSPAEMYSYREMNDGESSLVRTAMRSKDRDVGEEKWVCYSEVVEEVSSSAAAVRRRKMDHGFLLKLDYQEILNAWNDKGSFFIGGESSRTVPDFNDDDFLHHEFTDGQGSVGNVWRVPEDGSNKEGWNSGQREASVLRYKEKRQNRLFAKRIRYEVRKLNAEKRPRMKGRFVKRN